MKKYLYVEQAEFKFAPSLLWYEIRHNVMTSRRALFIKNWFQFSKTPIHAFVQIVCSTLCKYDSFCAYHNLSGYKNIHLSLKSKSLLQRDLQQPPFLKYKSETFFVFSIDICFQHVVCHLRIYFAP